MIAVQMNLHRCSAVEKVVGKSSCYKPSLLRQITARGHEDSVCSDAASLLAYMHVKVTHKHTALKHTLETLPRKLIKLSMLVTAAGARTMRCAASKNKHAFVAVKSSLKPEPNILL